MKLHLPKVLFVAVMAAAVSVAQAADYTLTQNETASGLSGGNGFQNAADNVIVGAGLTLTLQGNDQLGWSNNRTKQITLGGEADNLATLHLAGRQTMGTNIVMNGYSAVTGSSVVTPSNVGGDSPSLESYGGNITVTGTHNTISAALFTRSDMTISVAEGGSLDVTGLTKWRAEGQGALTKTGAGTVTFSNAGNQFVKAFTLNGGTARFEGGATFNEKININANNTHLVFGKAAEATSATYTLSNANEVIHTTAADGNNRTLTIEEGVTVNATGRIQNGWGISTTTVDGTLNVGAFNYETGNMTNTITGSGKIATGDLVFGNVGSYAVSVAEMEVSGNALFNSSNAVNFNGTKLTLAHGATIKGGDWGNSSTTLTDAELVLKGTIKVENNGSYTASLTLAGTTSVDVTDAKYEIASKSEAGNGLHGTVYNYQVVTGNAATVADGAAISFKAGSHTFSADNFNGNVLSGAEVTEYYVSEGTVAYTAADFSDATGIRVQNGATFNVNGTRGDAVAAMPHIIMETGSTLTDSVGQWGNTISAANIVLEGDAAVNAKMGLSGAIVLNGHTLSLNANAGNGGIYLVGADIQGTGSLKVTGNRVQANSDIDNSALTLELTGGTLALGANASVAGISGTGGTLQSSDDGSRTLKLNSAENHTFSGTVKNENNSSNRMLTITNVGTGVQTFGNVESGTFNATNGNIAISGNVTGGTLTNVAISNGNHSATHTVRNATFNGTTILDGRANVDSGTLNIGNITDTGTAGYSFFVSGTNTKLVFKGTADLSNSQHTYGIGVKDTATVEIAGGANVTTTVMNAANSTASGTVSVKANGTLSAVGTGDSYFQTLETAGTTSFAGSLHASTVTATAGSLTLSGAANAFTSLTLAEGVTFDMGANAGVSTGSLTIGGTLTLGSNLTEALAGLTHGSLTLFSGVTSFNVGSGESIAAFDATTNTIDTLFADVDATKYTLKYSDSNVLISLLSNDIVINADSNETTVSGGTYDNLLSESDHAITLEGAVTISSDIALEGNAVATISEGATVSNKGVTITGTDAGSTLSGAETGAAFAVNNAAVTVDTVAEGETATLEGALVDSAVTNDSGAELIVSGGDSTVTKMDILNASEINFTNVSDTVEVEQLTLSAGATVGVFDGELKAIEKGLTVTETLVVDGDSTMNANLTVGAGATLVFNGTLTMGSTVEFGEGITIIVSDDIAAQIANGDIVTLIDSIDADADITSLAGVGIYSGSQETGLIYITDTHVLTHSDGTFYVTTPEPATATLSLLALAALAARRKRH